MVRIALLGCGLIGDSYAEAILGNRSRDRIDIVYSRSEERRKAFQKKWSIPFGTDSWEQAIEHPGIDLVVVATPNHLHEECVLAAAKAGTGVLCTKPLGRTRLEAERMLHAVEHAGVFHGYLEDLVFTPKTQKALQTVASGALGKVLWVRSREAHSGPHSDWFWNKQLAGGGAIIDLGSHCIEIARSFIGKQVRPVEVMCWGDTQVHQIESEDHAIGLVRYENGAIGQFEVSWAFRGGMDLRDEVVGTEGTLWLNHWLRTGFEVFSAVGTQEVVAEKSESSGGWMFPVGDESSALGNRAMFQEMFDSYEAGTEPRETFRDGVIVNAIVDACYRSMQRKCWVSIDYGDASAVNLLKSPASNSNAVR